MFVKGEQRIVDGVRRLLLIQLGDIGDVVLTFPCVRALRERYPQAKIVLAVREKAAELIELCPWADEGVIVPGATGGLASELVAQWGFFRQLRRHRFDLAIDLRTGTRGAFLAFLSGARQRLGFDYPLWWRNLLFTDLYDFRYTPDLHVVDHLLGLLAAYGVTVSSPRPEFVVPPAQHDAAAKILRNNGVDLDGPNPVAIQPFSLWQYKEWAAEKVVDLIRHIRQQWRLPVVITGGPQERARAQEIVAAAGEGVVNLAGVTTLCEYAALLQHCQLFVGVDSAGQHLAAAVDVPTVILYGPSSPVSWAPHGPKHLVVRKDLACVPCRQTGCDGSGRSKCLDTLEFEEVWSVVAQQLRHHGTGEKVAAEKPRG